MATTPSKMVPLGSKAPSFSLLDTDGKMVSVPPHEDNQKKGLLVIFMCNHCPYVVHIASKLSEVTKQYDSMGIAVIGINANDAITFPDDSPAKMKSEKLARGYSFPYLFDESQETAKNYGAACTPDFFLYDQNLKLVYRGQFDESRPGNGVPVTGKDLTEAVSRLCEGRPIPEDQHPSLGCNIKWK